MRLDLSNTSVQVAFGGCSLADVIPGSEKRPVDPLLFGGETMWQFPVY